MADQTIIERPITVEAPDVDVDVESRPTFHVTFAVATVRRDVILAIIALAIIAHLFV